MGLKAEIGIRQLLCVVPQPCPAMLDSGVSHRLADLFCIPALEPLCYGSARHIHTAVTVVDIPSLPPFPFSVFLLFSKLRSPSHCFAVFFFLKLVLLSLETWILKVFLTDLLNTHWRASGVKFSDIGVDCVCDKGENTNSPVYSLTCDHMLSILPCTKGKMLHMLAVMLTTCLKQQR